jgi:hypothetical protein
MEFKKGDKLPAWIAENAHFGVDAKVTKKSDGTIVIEGSWDPYQEHLIRFGNNARQTAKSLHFINTRTKSVAKER